MPDSNLGVGVTEGTSTVSRSDDEEAGLSARQSLELVALGRRIGATDAAKSSMKDKTTEFVGRLTDLSVANAVGEGLTIVDRRHVEAAANALSIVGRHDRIKGELGMLLFGAGLAQVVHIINTGVFQIIPFLVCVSTLPLGAVLWGMSLRR